MNFFATSKNAERWLQEHPDVSGQSISMPEAIAASRAVFSDVLTEGNRGEERDLRCRARALGRDGGDDRQDYRGKTEQLLGALVKTIDERMLAIKRTCYLVVERRKDRWLDRSGIVRPLGRVVIRGLPSVWGKGGRRRVP